MLHVVTEQVAEFYERDTTGPLCPITARIADESWWRRGARSAVQMDTEGVCDELCPLQRRGAVALDIGCAVRNDVAFVQLGGFARLNRFTLGTYGDLMAVPPSDPREVFVSAGAGVSMSAPTSLWPARPDL